MISIIDYGVGNLFSLSSSFEKIGAQTIITNDRATISSSDKIILPGVGAFGDAILKLKETGLDKIIKEEVKKGKKLLGICLGMQLLFDKSYEFGEFDGLGLVKGKVVPMKGYIDDKLNIPHTGWNLLKIKKEHPLFRYIKNEDYVYFVHSYFATDCDENVIATTEYDKEITAAVAKDNVAGMQFHPEKSGDVGLSILRAFCDWED